MGAAAGAAVSAGGCDSGEEHAAIAVTAAIINIVFIVLTVPSRFATFEAITLYGPTGSMMSAARRLRARVASCDVSYLRRSSP